MATDLFVRTLGEGPPILFVHGGVLDGEATWRRQLPLAERFRLLVPDRRGYGRSPDGGREDFEVDAADLGALLVDRELVPGGAHLVGHSYGGLVALLAAAARPGVLRSLTVIEPPAFGLVRGDPAVEAFIARIGALVGRAAGASPEEMLTAFFETVGVEASRLPRPLPPELLRGARRLLDERPPEQAVVPVERLAAAPFPKLVVSGAHAVAYEVVCDTLAERIGAERAILAGRGHGVQALGEAFNERLAAFVTAAEQGPRRR